MTDEWADEREDVIRRFSEELRKATGDGSKKRQAGEKPPWYRDGSHFGAVFSHITKYLRGERVDPDSGAHPLVHAAWRLLAIACSENGNNPDAESDRAYIKSLKRRDASAQSDFPEIVPARTS